MREHVSRRVGPALAVALFAAVVLSPNAAAAAPDRITVPAAGTASFADKGGIVGTEPSAPTLEWRGPKRQYPNPLQGNQLSSGPDLSGGDPVPATSGHRGSDRSSCSTGRV